MNRHEQGRRGGLSPQAAENVRRQIYGVLRAVGVSTEDRPAYTELCLGVEGGLFVISLADNDGRIEFSVSARFNACRTNLVHGLVLVESGKFSVQSDVRSDLNRLVRLSSDVGGVFRRTIGFLQTVFDVTQTDPGRTSYLRTYSI